MSDLIKCLNKSAVECIDTLTPLKENAFVLGVVFADLT